MDITDTEINTQYQKLMSLSLNAIQTKI